MRRVSPTWPTLFSLLLALLLVHPLQAEESDSATPEASPETPAETPRAPLPERSEVDATALEQRVEQKEQQQLKAGEEPFLALWLPANVAEPSGAVIIVPGDDESADWPQGVGPLRSKLPNGGWHSLSLTLPDPNSDAPPVRIAEPARALGVRTVAQATMCWCLTRRTATWTGATVSTPWRCKTHKPI